MSERLQIRKVNKSTTDISIPNSSKLLDKNRKPLVSQPPLIQTKLAINQPGDQYEQEADRVAEQIMRMPDPVLQRKCARFNENEKNILQAKELPSQAPVTQGQDVPPLVHEVLRSARSTSRSCNTWILYGATLRARLFEGAGAFWYGCRTIGAKC